MAGVKIPKELLWDYKKEPEDLLWKLQRLADFFPMYGTDWETVRLLYQNLANIKAEDAAKALIKEYYNFWRKKDDSRRK